MMQKLRNTMFGAGKATVQKFRGVLFGFPST
jgi:hypothetical protein